MRSPFARTACLLALGLAVSTQVSAQQNVQDPVSTDDAPDKPSGKGRIGFMTSVPDEDRTEVILAGGLRLHQGDFRIRAERGVVVFDRDRFREGVDGGFRSKSDSTSASGAAEGGDDTIALPTRGYEAPPSRRSITPDLLRARLRSFLGSLKSKKAGREVAPDLDLELARSFYFEGDVVFVQGGREVLRASRVFFSVVDNRAIFDDVEMRIYRKDRRGIERIIVVRSDQLVRQGIRFVGHDVSVTTCEAAEPHFEIFNGETEIIERGDQFEIRSRDNWLAFGGTSVLPLPNARLFTGEPISTYLRGASVGYSSQQGVEAQLEFGAPIHEVGGAVHEWLTGRPAQEFRGEWQLGLGFIEERGVTFEPRLQYGVEGLYEGTARLFSLDDQGTNFRIPRINFDGTPVTETDRLLVSTQNRFWFNDTTRLDLTAFDAGDPSVYAEFYPAEYVREEIPETSIHFRHQAANYRFAALGRWNLADFSYGDARNVTESFVESSPQVSFDLFSEEIATLPGDTPLLLTTASEFAQLRRNFDDLVPAPIIDDTTTRFDQEIEIAAPFDVAGARFRPFARARFTHFSDTLTTDGSRDRWSFSAGIQAGTRLAREWKWFDPQGGKHALRHVISPTVEFEHTFQVDGDPGEFRQFDEVDALNEGANIRLGILQRLQERVATPAPDPDAEVDEDAEDNGPYEPVVAHEVVWFDLAQNFSPISNRDNGGELLGLAEFEFIVRPRSPWVPLDDFTILVEGEHDWEQSELRTFNTYTGFRALHWNWYFGYRADETATGVFTYGASTQIRNRWNVAWGANYDFGTSRTLGYAAVLTRQDHDWQLAFGFRRNAIIDETQFTIDFIPTFGGLVERRVNRGAVNDRFLRFQFPQW